MPSKPKPKILMSQRIYGAYKDLNEHRKQRYNERIRSADSNGLNFRKLGRIISRHGIRRFLESNNYHTGAHGLCAVCNKEAQICKCKIEVIDFTGNISYLPI